MSHWLYNGQPLLEAPSEFFGFVYLITNKVVLTHLRGQEEEVVTSIEIIVKMDTVNLDMNICLEKVTTIQRKIAADVERQKVSQIVPNMVHRTCIINNSRNISKFTYLYFIRYMRSELYCVVFCRRNQICISGT